ncbi:hypothetical protein BH20ACI1_BH20ACI1_08650 [soil metagenome]
MLKTALTETMTHGNIHKILNYLIAAVWLINGLFCKVLNFVPRHEQIVGRILGNDYAKPFTTLIGFAEIGMTIWILSRIKPKLNAVFQMAIVAIMNILEFFLVPDLLLWGRANAIIAAIFIILIYFNEFVLGKHSVR